VKDGLRARYLPASQTQQRWGKIEPMGSNKSVKTSPIGVDPGDLGAITPKHMTNNEPLAIAVLSYNRTLETQKKELETENETLKTYATNYEVSRERSVTTSGLNIIATVLIGIGTNLLTDNDKTGGLVLLISGVIISLFANIYLTFFKK